MEDVQNDSLVSHLGRWVGGGATVNIGEKSGMFQGGVDKEENEIDFGIVGFESPVSYLGRLLLQNCKGV